MATALQILNKLKKVDVLLSTQVAMEETADAATAAQRAQLAQGLKSTGDYLPDYSFRSVFQYGKTPGPIKLYDTGAFYRGILIDVRGDIYIMESNDEKSSMLQNRYGKDILGLGLEARVSYIQSLKPALLKQIRGYLN